MEILLGDAVQEIVKLINVLPRRDDESVPLQIKEQGKGQA